MRHNNIHICCFLYKKLEIIKQNIHRGKILQQVAKDSGINIAVIAGKAGYKRVTFYSHIKNPDLPDPILLKYGRALHHDFSEEIPSMKRQILAEPADPYSTEPENLKEAKDQTAFWKQKYYELLDKYVKLIENSV